MDLTTTTRVANLVNAGGTAPASFNTTVALLITSVSVAVEKYLDRVIQTATRTEYFDVTNDQRVFALKAFPVSAVTGVWFDEEQTWGSDTEMGTDEWRSPVYDPRGLLTLAVPQKVYITPGVDVAYRSLKVTYTGGMAADTNAFVAAYPDVAGAVDFQVAYLWHRRNELGLASVSGDAGSVSIGADAWLPWVKIVLEQYRRRT